MAKLPRLSTFYGIGGYKVSGINVAAMMRVRGVVHGTTERLIDTRTLLNESPPTATGDPSGVRASMWSAFWKDNQPTIVGLCFFLYISVRCCRTTLWGPTPGRPQDDPRTTPWGPRTTPGRPQDDSRTTRSQDDPRTIPWGPRDDPKTTPGRPQDDPRTTFGRPVDDPFRSTA